MDKTFRTINKNIEVLLTRLKKVEAYPIWIGARYAEIYVRDNAVSQSIPNGVAFTKSTAWVSNGQSYSCTADAVNSQIIIGKTGIYFIEVRISITAGTAGVIVDGAVAVDGVIQDNLVSSTIIASSGDEYCMVISGFANIDNPGALIDLRFNHDNGGAVNVTVVHGNMSVFYVNKA